MARIEGRAREPVMQVLLDFVATPLATRPTSGLGSVAHPGDVRPPDRTAVVRVLGKMGTLAESRAVSALLPLTHAESPSVRREAAECLGMFGSRARDAVPALERALEDDDLVVQCLSALSLSDIEGWEKRRARTTLAKLVENLALPFRIQKRVRWVVRANLVNGSEFSQPVHTLRALVEQLRAEEVKAALGSSQPPGPDSSGID